MVSLNNVEKFKLSTSRERNVANTIGYFSMCVQHFKRYYTEEIMIVYTSKSEILVLNFLKNPSLFDIQ